MQRDFKVYLEDVLEAIRRIGLYTKGLSYEVFLQSPLIQDAVLRNLTIIGEAVKRVPEEVRARYSEVPVSWPNTDRPPNPASPASECRR